MIVFAQNSANLFYAVECDNSFDQGTVEKLNWLFDGKILDSNELEGVFVGPRKEMISPWSTNAVEICQNMGISGISRIEKLVLNQGDFDPMVEVEYNNPNQEIFTIDHESEAVKFIDDIAEYNQQEGLALSQEEIGYLEELSQKLDRKLTDSEVFGFSQVNSEHCRHKIFNGTFIIDGEEKEDSLFKLIRKTTNENPNRVVSAYKDNVAFFAGPNIQQFAPVRQDIPAEFETKQIESVISLKAETHNFPTTVEPFNGAATGSGGEIRDRLAGGKAANAMAGTAVYMTSYTRLEQARSWESDKPERNWLYQTPIEILIKASNGASDFGNKYGQPLIAGSVLTYEHEENGQSLGFDKVIMLAGGVGFGKRVDAEKDIPSNGDKVVVMGGDNYRIGMGGGAVSSVDTGEFESKIELNAVQRSNPEMQKRVANVVRAMSESDENKIVSIHDHGAGGHLNCLSELVEETGGEIDVRKLPIGDPTLSSREIIGNESQERMGLVVREEHVEELNKISERERAPFYVVGEITGDHQFRFVDPKTGQNPIDLALKDFFGNPPKTIMKDSSTAANYSGINYDISKFESYLNSVLQLEAVACKDWLTNKVDRSVTGKVAVQQTVGEIQLPLNDLGVMALDYTGQKGIATSIGHAPSKSLIDPANGAVHAIAEALTNIALAPIEGGLKGISLSANWMWPCKNPGEDARLYKAVEAVSKFCRSLKVNVPTGKDSLSMKQKYPDGQEVKSPGTVIISAAGEVTNIRKVLRSGVTGTNTELVLIDFSNESRTLGGSSFAQSINALGNDASGANPEYFVKTFNAVQKLVANGDVLSGHDIGSGGLITTLVEMVFPTLNKGLDIDLNAVPGDLIESSFSENPGVVVEVSNADSLVNNLSTEGIVAYKVAKVNGSNKIVVNKDGVENSLDKNILRDTWFKTSGLLELHQTNKEQALARSGNYASQPLSYTLPSEFDGQLSAYGKTHERFEKSGVKAAIIREKGVNGDREMAYIMHLAGFDVKDVHMTDLISGREDLSEVNFIVFVGGFSNSDVLGSAKGWAGAFMYNEKARLALENFFERDDTMSLGVCNGCQLMIELGLITRGKNLKPKMEHNESGKFESGYINVNVAESNSIMLNSLSGSRLGIWVAHGEGKFELNAPLDEFNVALKYSYSAYPGNPNGSESDIAGLVSDNGRHLAMMPHLERAFFPWQCADYPQENRLDDVTPWFEAFVNAFNWVKSSKTNLVVEN